MEPTTSSFGSTDMEGDSSGDEDGREETATEEAAAQKPKASEQADGGSRR